MRRFLLAAALSAPLLCVAGMSSAAQYGFSFENVDGTINGTVSGTINLPDGDGVRAATEVFVASSPDLMVLTRNHMMY